MSLFSVSINVLDLDNLLDRYDYNNRVIPYEVRKNRGTLITTLWEDFQYRIFVTLSKS